MKKCKKISSSATHFILIISCIFLVFSFGCQKNETPVKPTTTLNIGLVTWPGFGPLFVAQQKGYFKENGLDLKVSIIDDEAARRSAFASGQLDIAANTVDALANGAPKGVDGKIFLKTDASFGADGIVAKKDIKSIAQLKGKKVAYPKGLPSHYFLYEVLKENNLSMNDITSVYMEASDAGAAFSAGKIDAAVTWEPWLSQSAAKGTILATTKDMPDLISDVLMVSTKSLTGKHDAVKGFLKAWFKGLEFIQKNQQESVKIISESLRLSSVDTEGFLTLVKFADLQENRLFFGIQGDTNICADLFSKASDLWIAEKIIDNKADPMVHCDGNLLTELIY